MSTLQEVVPLIRLPPLAATPVLARLAIGLLWLAIGLFGRPLSAAFLLVAGVVVLFTASGYTTRALTRVAWRPLVLIALVGIVFVLFTIEHGRPAALEAGLAIAVRLSLALTVALIVILPQDVEQAIDEAMAWLRLSPRIAFGLLVAARVASSVPSDLTDHGAARRALGLSPGGVRGVISEPAATLRYVVRAARRRWRSLRTSLALSALGVTRQRTAYRSVSFGRNGRYVLVGGLIVAGLSLLVGLI